MSRFSTFAMVTAVLLEAGLASAQAPRPTSRLIEYIPDAPPAVPAPTVPGFGHPGFPSKPHIHPGFGHPVSTFPAPTHPGFGHPVSTFPAPTHPGAILPGHPLPPPPANRVLGVTFSMTGWGPQITNVLPGSIAALSGLRPGDILLTANGHRLLSRNDFINHVSYSRRDVVVFEVWDARFGRAKLVRANFDCGNELEVRSAPTGFRR